jgi:hypothetical protein
MSHQSEERKIEVENLDGDYRSRHHEEDEGSGLLDEDLDEEQTRHRSRALA